MLKRIGRSANIKYSGFAEIWMYYESGKEGLTVTMRINSNWMLTKKVRITITFLAIIITVCTINNIRSYASSSGVTDNHDGCFCYAVVVNGEASHPYAGGSLQVAVTYPGNAKTLNMAVSGIAYNAAGSGIGNYSNSWTKYSTEETISASTSLGSLAYKVVGTATFNGKSWTRTAY